MGAWIKRAWQWLWWGWGRAGDLSLLSWLFPSAWAKFAVIASGIATAVVGIATSPPVFWIPLALGASAFATILVASVQVIRGERQRAADRRAGVYMKPAQNWMPLASAPFVVIKNEALTDEVGGVSPMFVEHNLADTIDLPIHPKAKEMGMTRNVSLPQYRTSRGDDLLAVMIGWENTCFAWRWGNERRIFGCGAKPWDLAKFQHHWPTTLPDEARRILSKKAQIAFSFMHQTMEDLIAAGRLRVWARHTSPLAPFTKIAPDAWRQFRITDWDRGNAECASDKLYAIHTEIMPTTVVPLRQSPQGIGFGSSV